jgi:hypothetical protein
MSKLHTIKYKKLELYLRNTFFMPVLLVGKLGVSKILDYYNFNSRKTMKVLKNV